MELWDEVLANLNKYAISIQLVGRGKDYDAVPGTKFMIRIEHWEQID